MKAVAIICNYWYNMDIKTAMFELQIKSPVSDRRLTATDARQLSSLNVNAVDPKRWRSHGNRCYKADDA